MPEIPMLQNYASVSNTYDGGSLCGMTTTDASALMERRFAEDVRRANQIAKKQETPMARALRIVQVFIADADEALPLTHALLFKGEPKMTDLTDQELFFEIPIKELLDKHNENRAKTLDKKASMKLGRDVFLEPTRISSLRMTVVDVAKF